jgi:hypothetical protein
MSEPKRIASNSPVQVGDVKVTNKTANAIMVEADSSGSVEIVDCCLEEQGK